MDSLWLAEHTWPEVESLIEQDWHTLLLMLGATEQHGPHLPLATDTVIAEAVAVAVAAKLGRTLIAPIVPLGTSDEHLDFCGTLSLSKATLAGLIADVGRSAARHRFKRLLVLSMHGGNYDAIRSGVAHLQTVEPGLQVIAFTDLAEEMKAVARPQRPDLSAGVMGWHAGERETSEMLNLQPELVQMSQAEAGYTGEFAEIMPRLMEVGLRPVTANGVLGDPTPATAERGAVYLAELSEALAAAINLKSQKEGPADAD